MSSTITMSTHTSLTPMTPRIRTFFGCLTCRKRKVKCDSREFRFPCGNCSRLNIPCTPSFHSNFKNSSVAHGATRARRKQRQTASKKDSPATSGRTTNPSPVDVEDPSALLLSSADTSSESLNLNDFDDFDRTFVPAINNAPSWLSGQAPSIFSYDVDDVLYDIGFQQCEVEDTSPSLISNSRAQTEILDSSLVGGDRSMRMFERNGWTTQNNAYHEQLGPPIYGGDVIPNSPLVIPAMNSRRGNANLGRQFIPVSSTTEYAESIQNVDWGLLPDATQVSVGEVALVRHYESTMTTFLSVKSPQWNLYTYMLRSPQGACDSPLRNSILAWTSLHISRRDENPLRSGAKYYNNACSAIDKVLKDLSFVARCGNNASRELAISDDLYMVLSTTFFLTQCNLMICDRAAFFERINTLKDVLKRHWESLRDNLDSLSSRLLIWLAYLDLRASLWGEARSGGRTLERQSRLPLLIDILGDLNALPNLRAVSENQSYLSECFGNNYPSTEIRDDLVQEPVNAAQDDIMCILSRVKAFDDWNDEMIGRNAYQDDPTMQELKASKVQALKAEIAHVRATCKSAIPDSLDNNSDVDRTSFHYLTVSALHLMATILLNRIAEPNVRTDGESQAAAHEICKIAHQLRRTGCLQTPRSLIWPLPIFIAGVETTDTIHQDWILDYIGEMEDWGPNMKSMRFLLRKIILRQEREHRRVKVRDMIQDFDLSIIL